MYGAQEWIQGFHNMTQVVWQVRIPWKITKQQGRQSSNPETFLNTTHKSETKF